MNFGSFLLWGLFAFGCTSQKVTESHLRRPTQITNIGDELGQAQSKLDTALKAKGAQVISQAYVDLVEVQVRARQAGLTCDFGIYLRDVVNNLRLAVMHDPTLESRLEGMPFFEELAESSFNIRLMAAGFTKDKAMTVQTMTQKLNAILKNTNFTLYKSRQGLFPSGELQVRKGTLRESFFDAVKLKPYTGRDFTGTVALMKNRRLAIMKDGLPLYEIFFLRNGKRVRDQFRPSDVIKIKPFEASPQVNQFSHGELFLDPDEC